MPGAFASLDTGFPNLSGNGSTDDKLRAIQDYLYQLLEQLRYSMNNLGAENFNENSLKEITDKITEPIKAEIVDVERGLTTLIEITAEGVRLDVRRDYAAEWTSANNQKYYVGDVVKVTASDNSVKFYKCTQNHTAAAGNKPPSAYWTEIAAADVAYSRFDMNADAIRTEVTRATAAEGTLSTSINQTADAITLAAYRSYAPLWAAGEYYYGNIVRKETTVGDTVTVKFYKCTAESTTQQPPNTDWTEIQSPDVLNSRFSVTAEEIRSEVSRAKDAESLISQKADSISLEVQGSYAPEWSAGKPYSVGDIVKITTYSQGEVSAVQNYRCATAHTSAAGNKPPSAYWTEIAADTVVNSRFTQTAGQIALRVTQNDMNSALELSAGQIKSTVAGAQSKYDTTGVNVTKYGYGAPSGTASSGTIYLDQETGYYYTYNGSSWAKSANPLPIITTELQSQITQLPGEIMLNVRKDYADAWRGGNVVTYHTNDIVRIASDDSITFYKCLADHQGNSGNRPGTSGGASYWTEITQPNVQSMIDLNLNGVSISYDSGQSGANTPFITLNKDGTTIGGGPVYIGELNADTITSGTLKAGNVALQDEFSVYAAAEFSGQPANVFCGKMGGVYDDQTYTQFLRLQGQTGHVHITLQDEQLVLWCGDTEGTKEATISMTPTSIVANKSIIMPSDARIKKDIDHDLSRYEDFFMALKPCRYRMLDGSSGRYHTGYIAQEVEQALLDSGLSTNDLAALVKNPDADGYSKDDPMYGLRYSEMIALQTHMIQKLEHKITDLENRVRTLEDSGHAS